MLNIYIYSTSAVRLKKNPNNNRFCKSNLHYTTYMQEIETSSSHAYSTDKALSIDTKVNDFVTLTVTILLKIAFTDFVAAGGIVFHKRISFNLKSAPVGKLEDFFSNWKNSKIIPPKFDCFVRWRHGTQAIQNSDGCLVYIFSFLSNRNEAVHVFVWCQHIVIYAEMRGLDSLTHRRLWPEVNWHSPKGPLYSHGRITKIICCNRKVLSDKKYYSPTSFCTTVMTIRVLT